ncbi:hypothetical protein DFH06DRAFT_1169899, partial [Mycena polygramma]
MASSSQGQSQLASLPPELLEEIISHYSASSSFLSPLARQEHVPQRLVRQQALRSLSQCCVHLRRVFIPLVWEHMEFSARIPSFEERYVGAESELAELFTYIKWVSCALSYPPYPPLNIVVASQIHPHISPKLDRQAVHLPLRPIPAHPPLP